MAMMRDNERRCATCGRLIPQSAPAGVCPHCLADVLGASSRAPEVSELSSGSALAETISGEAETLLPALHSPSAALRVFGDYEVLEEIARGGMGIVYKTRQISLDRIVALKMILAGTAATREFIHRFRTEAAAAANLQHPNIVAVHEVGSHEGENFLAMEFVDGPNLAHLVGNQPLSAARAARYVKAVAEAIQYAHDRGIVHRDLKPSNILVGSNDQPRVTDFGLAKRLDAEQDLTLSGQVLGSPNYMAPEQASGNRAQVGKRSDIYALGAVLYHLLTARPPFQAETLTQTLQQVVNDEPLAPRLLNGSVPKDLQTICLKCLEKEPSRRYQTARELAEELERFLNDEPIQARPVSRPEIVWRWCRRRPLVAALSATTLALLLVVAIGSPMMTLRISRANKQARMNEQQAVQTARELRQNLYVSDVNNALQEIQRQEFGSARARLAFYRTNAPGEQDLRGLEWRLLWEQCRPDQAFSFQGHASEVTCAVFSPDGSLLVTGGFDGVVQVWDFKARHVVQTLRGFDGLIDAKAVAFSPDGKLLVAKGGQRLRGWRIADWIELGPPVSVVTNWNFNNAVAFSPDGGTLATRVRGGLGFVDVRQWRTNGLVLKGRDDLGTVSAYSPEGGFLAVSDYEKLMIYEARAPFDPITVLTPKEPSGHRIMALAISRRYLAAGFRDSTITLWDRETWDEIVSVRAHRQYFSSLAFSPDERLLASCADDQAIRLWRVEELVKPAAPDAVQPILLQGHTRQITSVAFAHDGRQLVSSSADGAVHVYDLPDSRNEFALPRSRRAIWVSADGRKLLMIHSDQTLHLWDVLTRADLGEVGGPIVADEILGVSADGELAATKPEASTLELRAIATGGLVRSLPLPEGEFLSVRFASRSVERSLAIATKEKDQVTFRFWNLDADRPPLSVGSTTDPRATYAFSDDGRWLAFAASDGAIQLFEISTRHSRTIPLTPGIIESVLISPDNSTIAVVGTSQVRLCDLHSGRELEPLPIRDFSAISPLFSPDGRTLLSCNFDGEVRFWNVPLRKQLMTLESTVGDLRMQLSSDGSTLALPVAQAFASVGQCRVWRAPSLPELDAAERAQTRQVFKP